MAILDRSVAALRISADLLDPTAITGLLGREPTRSQSKGQVLVGKVTGIARTAKFGMWTLEATDAQPGDLEFQINEILSSLTDDLNIWRDVSSQYDVDLYCGFFLAKSNEGISINAAALSALGQRGIELILEMYSGKDDE